MLKILDNFPNSLMSKNKIIVTVPGHVTLSQNNNFLISSKNQGQKEVGNSRFNLTDSILLWHCRGLDGCYGCRVDRVSMLSVCPDTELDIRIQ